MRGIKILVKDSVVTSGEKQLVHPRGHISLQNVSFRYDDYKKHTHVIDDV